MNELYSYFVNYLESKSDKDNVFTEVCYELLTFHSAKYKWSLELLSNNSKQYNGIDAFGKKYPHPYGKKVGILFCYCTSPLSKNTKKKIESYIISAKQNYEFFKITLFVVLTPIDFSNKDMIWFDNLEEKMNSSFKIVHWGKKYLNALFNEFPEVIKHLSPDNIDSLSDVLKDLITEPTAHGLIDGKSYLSYLNKEILILEDHGNTNDITKLLKNQIKQFCINSEIYFTNKIAEEKINTQFLYSDSSLIDIGINEYLEDEGWMTLLYLMGQSFRQFGGEFIRCFFLKIKPLNTNELLSLVKIIKAHLKNGIKVAIVDDDDVPNELKFKRNMALLGKKVLLHATDQISWDLSLNNSKSTISYAYDQYYFFRNIAKHTFTIVDNEKKIIEILSSIFNQNI